VEAAVAGGAAEAAVDGVGRPAARGPCESRELRRGERLLRPKGPCPAALHQAHPEAVGRRVAVRDAEERDPAGPQELEVRGHDGAPPLAEEVLAEPERHRDVEGAAKLAGEVEDVGLDALEADAVRAVERPRLLER